MPKKRISDEQITFALRQADGGAMVGEFCRKMGIAEATFHTAILLPDRAALGAWLYRAADNKFRSSGPQTTTFPRHFISKTRKATGSRSMWTGQCRAGATPPDS